MIEEAKGRAFNSVTPRILLLCELSRQDIQTVVASLTTRVKEKMQEDWKELVRGLESLKGTQEKFLTLSMEDTKLIKWWMEG